MRRVCVVGLGYIGLPTAALLARREWQVIGVDVNPAVVSSINRGAAHISEPDIDDYVHAAVTSGMLRATETPEPADVYVICVPTPFHAGTQPPVPNLDHVIAAANSLLPVLAADSLLIIESTCPVGTTERVRALLTDADPGLDGLHVAYCPERVLPGRILTELVSNDRIVGGVDAAAADAAEGFYHTFVEGAILRTDSRTAEMVKLVENSFRDVNIAFANEISVLCERLGIDAWEMIALANHHPRVNILQPGPGVGGHCIAVDPWFIVAEDPDRARLIRIAREVNDAKTEWVVDQLSQAAEALGIAGRPVRIACLGLAYKPDIDDLRESPAVKVAIGLRDAGFEVIACEPNIPAHPDFDLHTAEDAVRDADLVALLVAHSAFGGLDFGHTPVRDFCGLLVGRRATERAVAAHARRGG
jgi:UDP-N-acetyl-D-mannosaminuronic acid dehydrogenase